MATAKYTFPDGRTAKIEYETEDQLNEAIRALEGTPKPRGFLQEGARQLGLTARYGLEAFGQTALPDIVGLPEPETDLEKAVGGASRLTIQAAPIAKGAQIAEQALQRTSPLLSSILKPLGVADEAVATSAAGAGALGEQAKNEGYGPVGQFIASMIGGFGGAVAGTPARAMTGAAESLYSALRGGASPRQVEETITVALRNAGVEWGTLSRQAQEQLVKDAADSVKTGEPLNPDALRRMADFRNIGATPMRGDVTMNPGDVTRQRNLSKRQANVPPQDVIGPNISEITNENAGKVISTIDNLAESSLDTHATGQRLIDSVTATDDALKASEGVLYREARDAAGRDLPLDRAGFVNQAFDNLEQSGRVPFLPGEVRTILNGISDGSYPFNVQTIDNLKTILASASRGSKDGNVKASIKAVRDALENVQPKVPTKPGLATERQAAALRQLDDVPAEALSKFDKARTAAKGRRDWQESSPFIEDALGGAEPDKFVQKHVINAPVSELGQVRQHIAGDEELIGAVRRQLVEYIASRGNLNAETRTFSSAGMERAFKQIGERKLSMFFSPEELQQLRSAINVARYMQAQPIGSAVNNSNTGGMLLGFLDRLWKGSGALPVIGPQIVAPVNNGMVSIQARRMLPGGGMFGGDPMLVPAPQGAPVPYSPLAAFAIAPSSQNDERR